MPFHRRGSQLCFRARDVSTELLQIGKHLSHVLIAIFRIFLQRLRHDPIEPLGELLALRLQGWWSISEVEEKSCAGLSPWNGRVPLSIS